MESSAWKPRINYNNHHKPSGGGRFKANAPCRKHPRHRQSPGVCSLCLNEKLSHLASTNNAFPRGKAARKSPSSSSSSSSSSYLSSLSSSNASSYSSPVLNYARRMDSEARKSSFRKIFKFNNGGQGVLKKSRSTAFALQLRRNEEDDSGKIVEIKRSGFWSKLLPGKNKGLMHSRTMRERVIAEVH